MTTVHTEISLAGRVHSAMRPLPGTTLTLTDRAGVQVGRARTGQAGEFQLAGLAPGSYVVIFSRAGYQPRAEVVLLGTATDPLDITLEPAISVHGVVHDKDSGQPPPASPSHFTGRPSPPSRRAVRSSPAPCPTRTAATR